MTREALGIVAAALLAGTAPDDQISFAELEKMPADQLADAILPPDHPAMVRFQAVPLGPVWGNDITYLEFYSVATSIEPDFCRQYSVGVSITPVPVTPGVRAPMPKRAGEPLRTTLYRYRPPGTACDARQNFFATQSDMAVPETPPITAFRVVRLLRDALHLARHRRLGHALPFRVTCRDLMLPSLAHDCAPLRSLDLGQIGSVTATSPLRRAEIAMVIDGNMQTTLKLTFHAGRIARLRVSQGMIVY
jgi:hypothetical protein